jgi:hypothetical protein
VGVRAYLATERKSSQLNWAGGYSAEGLLERAAMVMDAAKEITADPLPPPAAIAEADERLNLALIATLFNARHGLAGLSEDIDGQLDQFAQWLESYKITVGAWLSWNFVGARWHLPYPPPPPGGMASRDTSGSAQFQSGSVGQ